MNAPGSAASGTRARLLVTGPTGRAAPWCDAAESAGWEPLLVELLEIRFEPTIAPLAPESTDWVVLASRNALEATRSALAALVGTRFACVGEATHRELCALGLVPAVPAARDAEELLAWLAPQIGAGERVFAPRGSRSAELAEALARGGARVDAPVVYQSLAREMTAPLPAADAVFFASPSCVEAWLRAPRETHTSPPFAVAMGAASGSALRGAKSAHPDLFGPILVLSSPHPEALGAALQRALGTASMTATHPESEPRAKPRPRSEALFERAKQRIPGGVNSPVRAWKAVGGTPLHVERGAGPYIFDVDGGRYIDLVMSYGPLLLGHAPAEITAAIRAAAEGGTTFGAPTERELLLAECIARYVPYVERVRLVNSGTEATMSALRLARAHTGRDLMLKFEGCYHGHGDSFLVKAGSGALTLGAPDSPGVPRALAEMTLVAGYNDLDSVRELFTARGDQIAAVFVEPVAGNMGCVLPVPGFLEGLRELCDQYGSVLVFDEVMTGFRVARGGYAEVCGVTPDLVTLGKVIGAGLPIGAYGGRSELMQQVAPAGRMYQAGTLSGNPLAVAAGLAMMEAIREDRVYTDLERAGARLQAGLEAAARRHGVPLSVGRQGSMICPYFLGAPVTSFGDAMASDRERWVRFFHGMLNRGVHLPPSPFEAWFLSTAHDDGVVDALIEAADGAIAGS